MADAEYYYVRLNKTDLRSTALDDSDGEPAFGHPELGAFRDIHSVEAFGRTFIGGGGEVISAEEKEALESGAPECCTEDGVPLLEVIGEVGDEERLNSLIRRGELG